MTLAAQHLTDQVPLQTAVFNDENICQHLLKPFASHWKPRTKIALVRPIPVNSPLTDP